MTTPRRPPFPRLTTDQEAAEFWSRRDSTTHARDLPEVSVAVASPLRRRRIPSEDLLRIWIAAALAKEGSG